MKLTDYSNLKEVHSLDNMIKTHLDKINEEKGRIDFIQQKRKQKDQELLTNREEVNELEKRISAHEVLLFDLEKRLKNAEDHLPLATNEKEITALQNEINSISPQVNQLQDDCLSLLEKIEELECQITQSESFLAGSLTTLSEIKSEVEKVEMEELKSIHQYEERIKSLMEITDSNLVNAFLEIREKFRYKRPLVKIVNHSCDFCHFRVDQMTLSRVEACQSIETCSQCGRLLAPLEA